MYKFRFLLSIPSKRKTFCTTFIQRRPNVIDDGPTLYKCYTNVCVYWVADDVTVLVMPRHLIIISAS